MQVYADNAATTRMHQTAIDTIRDFLKENDMTVYLVLFDREACKIAEKIFVEEL